MSEFYPFLIERVMSKNEKEVEYNLSESGVYPLFLKELLAYDSDCTNELLDTNLDYAHANGIPELRENIAALYDGATPDNVLVTAGAIEANYNSIRTLLDPGDEIVIMMPNYMQIWGGWADMPQRWIWVTAPASEVRKMEPTLKALRMLSRTTWTGFRGRGVRESMGTLA